MVLSEYCSAIKDLESNLRSFVEEHADFIKYRIFKELIYYQSLAKNLDEFLYNTLKSMKNDLCYRTSEDKAWKELDPYYEEIKIYDEDKIKKSFEYFSDWIIIGNAMFSRSFNTKSVIKNLLQSAIFGSVYFLDKTSREEQFKYFVANPHPGISKIMWESIDMNIFCKFYTMKAPRVKVNQIIYLPKMIMNFREVLANILKEHVGYTTHELSKGAREFRDTSAHEEVFGDDKHFLEYSVEDRKVNSFHTDDSKYDVSTHVKVRILSNVIFPYNFKRRKAYLTKRQQAELATDSKTHSFRRLFC